MKAAVLRSGESVLVTPRVFDLVEKDKKEHTVQKSQEWLDRRKKFPITGSATAPIIGHSKYKNRLEVMMDKLGIGEVFTGNEATAWGEKYEDEAIAKYEKRTGKRVLEFGLLTSIYDHITFAAASPDGITTDGVLIEVKCPKRRIPVQGQVPQHYMPQLQLQMHLFDLEVCDFVEYLPEGDWRKEELLITRVERDPEWWKTHEPALREFSEEYYKYRKALDEGKLELDALRLLFEEKLEMQKKRPKRKVVKRKELLVPLPCLLPGWEDGEKSARVMSSSNPRRPPVQMLSWDEE